MILGDEIWDQSINNITKVPVLKIVPATIYKTLPLVIQVCPVGLPEAAGFCLHQPSNGNKGLERKNKVRIKLSSIESLQEKYHENKSGHFTIGKKNKNFSFYFKWQQWERTVNQKREKEEHYGKARYGQAWYGINFRLTTLGILSSYGSVRYGTYGSKWQVRYNTLSCALTPCNDKIKFKLDNTRMVPVHTVPCKLTFVSPVTINENCAKNIEFKSGAWYGTNCTLTSLSTVTNYVLARCKTTKIETQVRYNTVPCISMYLYGKIEFKSGSARQVRSYIVPCELTSPNIVHINRTCIKKLVLTSGAKILRDSVLNYQSCTKNIEFISGATFRKIYLGFERNLSYTYGNLKKLYYRQIRKFLNII